MYSRTVPFWATIVAALDKLQAPHRIWTYVHQHISVITVATNEKKSTFVGLGFDFIETKCALQFRPSPLGYLRRGFRRFASCPDSEGRRGNSGRLFFKRPVSEGARVISRLVFPSRIPVVSCGSLDRAQFVGLQSLAARRPGAQFA
ncbi:hypothetical protein SB861_43540 [Paraburkholderia sp. SIMBA_049]